MLGWLGNSRHAVIQQSHGPSHVVARQRAVASALPHGWHSDGSFAFVISPISPHTLTVRPVVDSADRVFEMVVHHPNEWTSVVVDGQLLAKLEPHDKVRVARARPTFKMIEVRQQNYYRTLREKLGWGGNLHQIR